MLARLSEMVCRRLRDQHLHARTLQLKLRYTDFTTITRARTVDEPTAVDSEVFAVIRELFRANWNRGAVRLLGVHAAHFDEESEQLSLNGQTVAPEMEPGAICGRQDAGEVWRAVPYRWLRE